MKTNLNEVLTELKLSYSNFRPNLSKVLEDLKLQEAKYYRSKVISLSQSVIQNPNNRFQQVELNSSLNQLEIMLTA